MNHCTRPILAQQPRRVTWIAWRSFVWSLCAISASFATQRSTAGQMDGEWISVAHVRAGVQQNSAPNHAIISDGTFCVLRDGAMHEVGTLLEEPEGYTVTLTGDNRPTGSGSRKA